MTDTLADLIDHATTRAQAATASGESIAAKVGEQPALPAVPMESDDSLPSRVGRLTLRLNALVDLLERVDRAL